MAKATQAQTTGRTDPPNADDETDEPNTVETPSEEREPEPLPLDVTFEILKNQRRRLVLSHLDAVDGETTIGELAEHIAAIENDCTVQELGAQQRKRVYIGLYQCHLPKMDDASVVDFNRNRGRVELQAEADPLFEYLEEEDESADGDAVDGDDTATESESVDPRPYAGATLGMGALFATTQLLGYYLIASLVVFTFLAGVLYTCRGMSVPTATSTEAETEGE
ncbi:hypothetical protein Hbl1158_15545 (plasmid) [Halobaculum sp. CBA1158]|uniref:DUF7344 domain-containing protein n=1 Tax=Halobaculum sp. CBA1158 TaxID=2904243 RepID=UPI001F194426|nr:hypothetical protein [Halobaculum sp. CBA1158]UIP01325.1 hypothetical protein Hbl1158_15545 [Halobaculum sp. CBA1158]